MALSNGQPLYGRTLFFGINGELISQWYGFTISVPCRVAGLPPSRWRLPITGVLEETSIGQKCDTTWRPFQQRAIFCRLAAYEGLNDAQPLRTNFAIPTVLDGLPARAE